MRRTVAACLVAVATSARLLNTRSSVPRRAVAASSAAALLALPGAARAAAAVAAVNGDGSTVRPLAETRAFDVSRKEDISERIFGARDWPPEPPWTARDFRRIDERDDAQFYAADEPKFVYHVDAGAVAALTNYYAGALAPGADVLDLCSSWVSHYPEKLRLGRVAGVGMNAKELAANARLTESVVRDLNADPKLPFPDKSFDAVTLVVSVDYLTRPVEILREARRVLRPGGAIILSQSNRLFMTKAIAMWLSMGDEAHLELIGQYLAYAGFAPAAAFDISARGRGARDPMYVVTATAP